ncbi:MAG: hypothetical protein WC862_05535 [Patescibacteria group bacterium]
MSNIKKNLLTWLGLTAVGFFIFGIPVLLFLIRSDNLLLFSSKIGLFLGKLSFLLIFIYIILSFALFLIVALFKQLDRKKVLIGWLIVMFLSWGIPNIIYREIYIKNDQLNLGPNPFNQNEIMKPTMHTLFWEPEFWMSKDKRIAKLTNERNENDRRSRLIKHVDEPEPLDISEELAIKAFGVPAQKRQIENGFEEWVYYPWTNHKDWALSVYFKDGKLWSIGEILDEEEREELLNQK